VAHGEHLGECVINISEGRDTSVIAELTAAGDAEVLDVHSDAEHNRSVFTLGATLPLVEDAARRVTTKAVSLIDIASHVGIHPRFGVADVVPFVSLHDAGLTLAVEARDGFAAWAGKEFGLPCFLYGPERTLPEVRRQAFTSLRPQTGPSTPHPTAGATAVGARPPLVAYNIWLAGRAPAFESLPAFARAVAASLRGPKVRTLGLQVADGAQVSCNLIDPTATPIDGLYDRVSDAAHSAGVTVLRAELVGLIPRTALTLVPRSRWRELDLSDERTIEGRLQARGYFLPT
jgi:glutamate formiminotransferase